MMIFSLKLLFYFHHQFVIFILCITVCYFTFIIIYVFLIDFSKPFGHTAWHVGSYFPDQKLNVCPHSLEAWSPNPWTTREVLYDYILPVSIFFLLLDRSMTCGSVKSSVIICFSQQCMQKFLMVMMVTYDAYISYFSVFICGEEFMHLFILLSKFLLKFSSFTMLCKCTSK